MLEEREGDVAVNSEDIACEYCQCPDPRCLVKCKEDGRWFCNNKSKNGPAHIICHLVKARAKTIELPASSSFARIPLFCSHCGTENIFELLLVPTEEATYHVACKMCLSNLDVARLYEHGDWCPFVLENNFLAPWFVEQLAPEQLEKYLSPSMEDIDFLEEEWKIGNSDVSIRDVPEIRQARSLPDYQVRFQSESEYGQVFAKFVERERAYQKAKIEESLMRHILVRFDTVGAVTYVRFKHALPESCPSWCVGADVTVKGGDFCEEAIVEYIGFDNRVLLRIKKTGWVPEKMEEYCQMVVVFNETPFKRQMNVLTSFMKGRVASRDIRCVWLGDIDRAHECDLQSTKCTRTIPGFKPLNDSQYHAVHEALNSNFTIIQGPPGTGKTTTITGYVYNRLQRHDGKILVCAPSNVAVEHLTRYIERTRVNVVRLMSRQYDDVSSLVDHCTVNKLIYKMGTKSSNRLRELQEKRTKEGLSSREDHEYLQLREEVELDILRHADVVCCTTVTAGCKVLDEVTFPYVVVDEATQGVEPDILIPLCHGCKQLVLVGDHMQLGPTVGSPQTVKAGYGRSIVERLVQLGLNPRRLTVQYRMHPAIAEFPSN